VKSLRHWAATAVTGVHDLSTAQRKLRHRHITTTQRYSARIADRDRAAAETTGRLLRPASESVSDARCLTPLVGPHARPWSPKADGEPAGPFRPMALNRPETPRPRAIG
jgi:hypothetical protein